MSRNRKRKGKLSELAQGDPGPQTAAQMVNRRIVEIIAENGAVFQRKVKDSHIAALAAENGNRGAMITPRQAAAGIMYEDAALNTQLSGEVVWSKVFVDCNSRFGDMNPAKIDAMTNLRTIEAMIPRDVRQVVRRVCLDEESVTRIGRGNDRRIGKLKTQLRRGLGALAKELGLG